MNLRGLTLMVMCERRNRGDMFGWDMKAFKFVTISKERFDYLCNIERKYYKVQKTVGVDPGVVLADSTAQGVLQSKVLGEEVPEDLNIQG